MPPATGRRDSEASEPVATTSTSDDESDSASSSDTLLDASKLPGPHASWEDAKPIDVCALCYPHCTHQCDGLVACQPYICGGCGKVIRASCGAQGRWPVLIRENWPKLGLQDPNSSLIASSSYVPSVHAPDSLLFAPTKVPSLTPPPRWITQSNPEPAAVLIILRCFLDGCPPSSAKALDLDRAPDIQSLHREYHALFPDELMILPSRSDLYNLQLSESWDTARPAKDMKKIKWLSDTYEIGPRFGSSETIYKEDWFKNLKEDFDVKEHSRRLVAFVYLCFRSMVMTKHGFDHSMPDYKDLPAEEIVPPEIRWFREHEVLNLVQGSK